MKTVKSVYSPIIALLLACALLTAPALTATAGMDTMPVQDDRWTIPQYTAPVVINSNKSIVTLDKTWGDKQFTVDQKMLTQGGYGQSTGWGNVWVNNDSLTGLPYQPDTVSFDVWMGWETGYFDFAIQMKNHTNYNVADGNTSLWQYDCLMFQISNAVTGTRYEYGVARGTGIFPNNLSFQWFPDEKEAPLAQNTEYAVNTSGSTTLYQLKIPLAKFDMDPTQWKQGGAFPFSFALHVYDPNDTTGVLPLGYFMEWASGVVGGTTEKTLDSAATITLGSAPIIADYGLNVSYIDIDTGKSIKNGYSYFGPDKPTGTWTAPDIGGYQYLGYKYDYSSGLVNSSSASVDGHYNIAFYYKSVSLGDVSGDGTVDTTDARMILQSIVGKLQLSDNQKTLADVNKDNKIDTADARIVLQVIVGKLAPLGTA